MTSLVAVEKVGHRRECGSTTLNLSGKGPTLKVLLGFSEAKGVEDHTVPVGFYFPHGVSVLHQRFQITSEDNQHHGKF